jgi:septum formation protein
VNGRLSGALYRRSFTQFSGIFRIVLILASNSPRRKELLTLLGLPFHIRPAEINEDPLPGEAPRAYVLRLAEGKARAIVARDAVAQVPAGSLVIAADTTVADGLEILGKPEDELQAVEMLNHLRGHLHQVYTAVAILRAADGRLLLDACVTDVPMRDYSQDEITAYVATGDPLDKAGAYAIQHDGFHPVEHLDGCYANVVGLPLCHLTRLLRKLTVEPQANIPIACQAALKYDCPVFTAILDG